MTKEEIKKKKKEEFGNKLAQAMVDHLNKTVNEKEKKIAEFGKEFGKAVVEGLNYQENKEEINIIDKTKQSPPPMETPEDKARLYIHLAESGQITEKPLMNYEEALKWFTERMKEVKSFNQLPKTDLFKFKANSNLKKPKTDYGALTVKALRRMK